MELYEIILELEQLKEEDIKHFWERVEHYKVNNPLIFEELKNSFPEINRDVPKQIYKGHNKNWWVFPAILVSTVLLLVFLYNPPLTSIDDEVIVNSGNYEAFVLCDYGSGRISVSVSNIIGSEITGFEIIINGDGVRKTFTHSFEPVGPGMSTGTVSFSTGFLSLRSRYDYKIVVGGESITGYCTT